MATTRDKPAGDRWLAKLTKLNPATGRGEMSGKAPHKPLILLSLLDLAEKGELQSRAFARTPGLALRFRSYGTLVADRWPNRLDLRLPFFHLSSQKFWVPLTIDRQGATSPDDCVVCEMDPEFYALLADPDFRLKARLVLVAKYFEPVEQVALFETLGLKQSATGAGAAEWALGEASANARRKGRSAWFQVRIVDDYRHTCALTGYQCFTAEGYSIVDAAHIESWAETQNDELDNGLALSKSAHWMFDQGLWTVDDGLRVEIHPERFKEAGPEAHRLQDAAGRSLRFDPRSKLRPSPESLRRHRKRHRDRYTAPDDSGKRRPQ